MSLSAEQIDMLKYFLDEKGDPSRYSGFEECCEQYPELKQVWDDYCTAAMKLTNLIHSLE